MAQPGQTFDPLKPVKLKVPSPPPPCDWQVSPSKSDASHASTPSRMPLPQTPVQLPRSKVQSASHASGPPLPPKSSQLSSFRSDPSHCSWASRIPLPQEAGTQPERSYERQSALQPSVPVA